jgi:hypothetical protein
MSLAFPWARRLMLAVFLIAWMTNALSLHGAEASVKSLRRLYDFTPVSMTNPVIASVRECRIEIPVSEFDAYLNMMVLPGMMNAPETAKTNFVTLAQKRRYLEQLLDDHFLLWDGYQQKADQSADLTNMLNSTQSILMQETLVEQEVVRKAKTPEDYHRLLKALQDRVFDQTDINVSNEAYEELKVSAKRLTEATNPPPAPGKLLSTEQRQRPLAKGQSFVVTTGDLLDAWWQTPAAERPDLQKQEGLIAMLKVLLADHLLIDEARARGLDRSPAVLERVQLNRNTLVRLFVIDQLAEQAAQKLKLPGTAERLAKWYAENLKTRYTHKRPDGTEQVVDFQTERDSIANDYAEALDEQGRAERLRALRKGRTITVNDAVLERWSPPLAPTLSGTGQ